MPFRDYSRVRDSNTVLGADELYIGPNMERNNVRPALQQLAADGKDLSDIVLGNFQPTNNYFPTIAEGIAGTAVGKTFSSTESGTLTIYGRTNADPFYIVITTVGNVLADIKRFYPDRYPYNGAFNGTTDDSDAILACYLDADAAGGAVIFPSGKSTRVSKPLPVPTTNGIKFIGTDGGAPCTIKATDTATNYNPIALLGTKRGGTSNINGCTITGLIFDANNRYGKGILTENAQNVKIHGNRFIGFSQPGNSGADPVFPLSAAVYHYCYPDVPVDPIGNDTFDNYIDCRPLVGGVQADPSLTEYGANNLGASLAIGYEGGSNAGSLSPPAQFALDGTAVPAAHRHRGGSVMRNTVLGAVYNLSLSVCDGVTVTDNDFAFASRNISMQNGANKNTIVRNKLREHFSTALLLNFVNNDNEIAYNEETSSRVVGNPVFQLAFGGSRNKIHHNKTNCPQSVGGSASHHIYVGMMANDNEVYENTLVGAFAKAMIAVESATTTTGSILNFGYNQPSGDYDLKVSGPSANNKVYGNRGFSTMGLKTRPFILLDQVTDTRGQWALTDTLVSGNITLNDDFSMVLQTITDTATKNTATYVNNPWGPGISSDRISIDPNMTLTVRSGNRGDPGLEKIEEGSWSSANGAFLAASGTGFVNVYDATVTINGVAYPGPNLLMRRGGSLVSATAGGVASRTSPFTTANTSNASRGSGNDGNVISRTGGTIGNYDAAISASESYAVTASPVLGVRHRAGTAYIAGFGSSATIPGTPLTNLRIGMAVNTDGQVILLVGASGIPYLSSGLYLGDGEVMRWWFENGVPSNGGPAMNGAVVQVRTSSGGSATLRLVSTDATALGSGSFFPYFILRNGAIDVVVSSPVASAPAAAPMYFSYAVSGGTTPSASAPVYNLASTTKTYTFPLIKAAGANVQFYRSTAAAPVTFTTVGSAVADGGSTNFTVESGAAWYAGSVSAGNVSGYGQYTVS